jgi:hypothetical protein
MDVAVSFAICSVVGVFIIACTQVVGDPFGVDAKVTTVFGEGELVEEVELLVLYLNHFLAPLMESVSSE